MSKNMAGNNSSIIFMNNDSNPSPWAVNNNQKQYCKSSSFKSVLAGYFSVPMSELPYRILTSLVPPLTGKSFVYVDLLGPSLALLLLAALLHYGHVSKLPAAAVSRSPTEVLLLYVALMPALTYVLGRVGRATIGFWEMVALLGYALYGHVLTLSVSLLFYQEKSNVFFFCCLVLFGGLSALRVVLVLLASIPLPAARLLICSLVATLQLLSLIYLHFAYMHRTFVYGGKVLHKS
ncbi:protein YIPF3-like [Anabrus simplex]|uniref:protein YIPF3-like n=1 Tax=Anabrus simplex TaxID=316456 RepID=UPI0034DDC5A1